MTIRIQGKRLDPSTDSPESRPLPRRSAPARVPFMLGHLPRRWDWDDELGRFLPQISTVGFAPGVQGTRALRKGPDGREQMDTSACRDHFARKGGILIDPADRRLGEFRAYQQQTQNDGGADVNYSIFESYDLIGDQVWWEHAGDDFRRFRVLLLDEQIVPDIHRRVRDRMIEGQEFIVQNTQRRYGAAPAHGGLRTELEMAQGRLRAMRDGIPTADALALIRAEQQAAPAAPVDAPASATTDIVRRRPGRPPTKRAAPAATTETP